MLAKRMHHIAMSPTAEMTARVAELRQEGKDIISLNVGEPDFATPEHIKAAGIRAIDENFTRYTAASGIAELRKAISAKLLRDNNISYAVNEICVTVGAKQAIFNTLMALCEAGDEVLIPIPCWVSYTDMVKLTGAEPVLVPTSKESGFALDLDVIQKAITDRTKAIILCTPNNPTGAVYSEKSLYELAKLACAHDFYIIADEVYEKLTYGEEKHFSIASISGEVWDRTVTINAVSKTYAMTGWRIGYAAAPRNIISAVSTLQSQTTSGACAISQKAALEAIAGSQEEVRTMVAEFDKRRRYVEARLNAMDGIECHSARGAFYVLPDVTNFYGKSFEGRVITSSSDLTKFLLEKALVSIVPGEAFNAPGSMRISYSNSMENLQEAMDRLEQALQLLR
ncbi:MAG TPA: pyridoxal phosphate-dependent aminotransferase [Syntrophomonas sp.]|nr:pyridoxal phosphate-dependent aminotransferase [Syntrophomonas sp.]